MAAQVTHSHHQSQPKPKWRLPPENYVKINFDGAVFPGANKSGIGVVIRNNRELVIASCSLVLHQEFNSNEIEAKAATKALSFAAELGLSDAVLERDSMVIIKALEEEHNPLSPIGPLIANAKFNSRFFYSFTLLSYRM